MALARHKAEGRGNRHWKRNHLFNSITGSHRRLLCHWCHLESRGGFYRASRAPHRTVHTHAHTHTSQRWRIDQENSSQTLVMLRASCPPGVINTYIVREISFVTLFLPLIPGGWFGVIDQRFRHRINKAFTSPLARARGSVMTHHAVQLSCNGILEPAQDY